METKILNILILNWNNKKVLSNCISSIKKSNFTLYDITVIDNGSSDGSIDYIKNKFNDINFIKIESNLGFAKGYNFAFEKLKDSKYKWYLLLNNDTILNKDTLSNLFNKINIYGENNIFTGKILNYYNKKIWYAGGKKNILTGNMYHLGINKNESNISYKTGNTEFVSGCFMLVKKEIIEKLNGFNQIYKMYYEDVDLCYRAKQIGVKCYFISDSILLHHISLSLGGRFSFIKIYNKMCSFFKFIYLNNKFYMFTIYLIINILFSPFYFIIIIIKNIFK